ncbi:GumC family protein, partial [Azospirillum sp. B506]|uniref:GumC family protein n=1 Tax=Azospirillum sp. B506 TaxID=137721 RepID=UPI00131EE3CD
MMETQTNSAATTVAGLTAPPPLTLSDLIQPVLRRKLLLFTVMLLFLSAAFGVLAVVEPRYTATAVIMVQPTDPEKFIGDANAVQRPFDLEEVRSQVEVLRSRALLAPIAERLAVARDAEFDPVLHPSPVGMLKQRIRTALEPVLPELAHLLQPAQEKPFDPVDMLLERLQVASLNRSHALSVSLEMQNPRLVMETVNAIVETYRSQTLLAKSAATGQARQQLDERIAQIEQGIAKAERRMEELRTGAGIIQGRSSSLTAEAVTEVNAELFRVRSQANSLAERQAVIERSLREGGDLSSAIDLSGSPVIGALRQREADARARVAQLTQYYGNLNPRIVAARSELADIRDSIRAELGKMQTALNNELAVVQMRQAALQREADRLAVEAAATSNAEQEIRSLEREIADAHSMLASFVSRQNRLEVQNKQGAPDAEILTLASLPPG